jgi:spore germination protein KC
VERGRRKVLKIKLVRNLLCLLLVLSAFACPGCGSKREPDDLSYVLLIGIDHGAENLLRISYLIAVPKSIGGGDSEGGGGGGPQAGFVTTIESPSLYASMNMVNTYVGRKISLMHAKGIIFSESMAKDGTMGKLISALTQFREIRGTDFVVVSREKPEEILSEFKPILESNPAKYMELLGSTSTYTGFLPNIQLRKFYNDIKTIGVSPVSMMVAKSDEKLPPQTGKAGYRSEGSYAAGEMVKKGGVAIEAIGGAVFRGYKMVGQINGDEIMVYNMIQGAFRRAIISFQDPQDSENIIALDVSQARTPRINISLTEQGAVIDVELSLEGNILGNTKLIDYGLPENRVVLEQQFAAHIKRLVELLVKKTQQEFRSDVLGFGIRARRLVLTEKELEKLDWPSLYENANVNINVNFRIRRTGLLFRIMPSKY